MRLKKLPLILAGSALFSLSSCIQDEPLNAECDIIGVDTVWINANKSTLLGSPIITNDAVSFYVKKETDRSHLDPSFYLTPGTQLVVSNGDVYQDGNGIARDFNTPQIYKTISEDGNWTKDYTVKFNYPEPIRHCSFENFELDKSGRYQVWYETVAEDLHPNETSPRFDNWASGNAGFALTGMGKTPEDYPSVAVEDGYQGHAIKLTTHSTGSFGEGVKMPIAAGSIFIGEFRASQAMLFPLKATRFGLQLAEGKPLYLSGYYKYTAGKVFTNKQQEVLENRKDTCDIYAVLFEVDPDKFVSLNGEDILTSDRIVSMARIDNPGEPQEWKYFIEPFKPMNGKVFDKERFLNDGYAITIVATSSRQGAFFEGAVGSTLYVDELDINWETKDL